MSLGNFLGSFVVFLSPFLWILGSLFLQELAKWEAYFLIGIVWLLTLSQIGFLVYTLMQPFMGMFTQTYGLALQHGVTLSSMLLVIIANMVRRFALNKDED
ncbi:MAG: hypothetical protein SFT92_06555 [Rickettsiales bacterium]|nr:hypothetical protein [Rickettsiales bacterium]